MPVFTLLGTALGIGIGTSATAAAGGAAVGAATTATTMGGLAVASTVGSLAGTGVGMANSISQKNAMAAAERQQRSTNNKALAEQDFNARREQQTKSALDAQQMANAMAGNDFYKNQNAQAGTKGGTVFGSPLGSTGASPERKTILGG